MEGVKFIKIAIIMVFILLSTSLLYSQGFGNLSGGNGSDFAKAIEKSEDALDKMDGLIPMRFYNALDRNPISEATVEIPDVGKFITNSKGKIVFPVIRDGNYTLTFSKEGFITTPIEFRVLLGIVMLNWYSISPGFINRDLRVVLEWGEKPADLDVHFVKTGGSVNYHISYQNMHTAEDGSTVLDRDDTTGYGPETITIGRIEPNAAYTCYVHDYTNRNNTTSGQMTQMGAVIRVYSQNRLLYTYRLSENGNGTRWDVFKVEQGAIVPINTVTAR
jgi:stress response protein SCP2